MDRPHFIRTLGVITALLAGGPLRTAAAEAGRFYFGSAPVPAGGTRVLPGTLYSAAAGYGFEPGADIAAQDRGGPDLPGRQFCTSRRPFFFSAAVPEGNYEVTVVMGDLKGESTTTVKSELRRLEVEEQRTAAGQVASRRFVVNVRTPNYAPGGVVRLKPREKTGEFWDWDGKLTLEFSGERPCICSVTIVPAPQVPTLFLAGDSTVCDQPYEPFASWGQMLPRFFGAGVAVANHAESGESLRSFVAENRLAKLDTLMRPGDFLLIQFGHNDQKERGENVGAFTSYKADLERFVDEARRHGTTPILVTPVSRRTFGADGKVTNSLGDYPDAVRRVAGEMGVALIDLNAMSETLYETLGPEGAKTLFPFANGRVEGTHHNNYGSYELAKCVVEGIRASRLPLASFLRDDAPAFDPAHPDPVDRFDVPASPIASAQVPYGN
jgi:lysophospholipase L1-like esterase